MRPCIHLLFTTLFLERLLLIISVYRSNAAMQTWRSRSTFALPLFFKQPCLVDVEQSLSSLFSPLLPGRIYEPRCFFHPNAIMRIKQRRSTFAQPSCCQQTSPYRVSAAAVVPVLPAASRTGLWTNLLFPSECYNADRAAQKHVRAAVLLSTNLAFASQRYTKYQDYLWWEQKKAEAIASGAVSFAPDSIIYK